LPDGQYDVALIDWRQHTINALETTLDRAGNRKLRAVLEAHGFVVEAGTARHHGSAVAARRCDPCPVSKAA
jgi:predicted outer membrane protein